MLSFDQLSCGIAIRHILSIRDENTHQFHAVFMIVDILEPDMQDYPADVANALKTKKLPFRSVASQSSNMYNAYLTKGQGTGTEVNPQSWTQHLLFICEEEH